MGITAALAGQYYADNPGSDQVPSGASPNPPTPSTPGAPAASFPSTTLIQKIEVPSQYGPVSMDSDTTIYGSNDPVFIAQTNLYPVKVWDYTPHFGPFPTGIPHTFIQTPNITRGYYPSSSWHFAAAFITSPGEIRDDAEHPRNDSPTQTFWVDAGTLSSVEHGMNWNPGFYELNNGFWNRAFNCTGLANHVLAGAGLNVGWDGVGANPWTN